MGWQAETVEFAIGQIKGYLHPSAEEQAAAYELLVEYTTRTVTAPLAAEDGTISDALSSVHELFAITREVLRKHGAGAAAGHGGSLSLALVASRVLNEVFRPVTSRWAPELAAWERRRETESPSTDPVAWERSWPQGDRCRADLLRLRTVSRAYTDTLARICGRPDLADAAQLIPSARTIVPLPISAGVVAEATNTSVAPRSRMVGWLGVVNGLKTWRAMARGRASGRAVQYRTGDPIDPAVTIDAVERDVSVDYVADLGDGFDPTMAVAWAVGRRALSLPEDPTGELPVPPVSLARGELLIMGGDEVYPFAAADAYERRTVLPYRLGWEAAADPAQEIQSHLVAVPGNHDWLGGIDHFENVFVAPQAGAKTFADHWAVNQRRRFWHVKLPHNWWIWGIDTALDHVLPQEQITYFTDVAAATLLNPGHRLIICTPEPLWQLAQKHPRHYRQTKTALEKIAHAHEARIALWLSGDSHFFAVYNDADGRARHLTSGGGGAFLHPTHNLPERIPYERGSPEQRLETRWPLPSDSRSLAPRPRPLRDRQYWGAVGCGFLLHLLFGVVTSSSSRVTSISDRGTNRLTEAIFATLSSWPGWIVIGVVVAASAFTVWADSREGRVRSAGKRYGLIGIGGGLAGSLLVVNMVLRFIDPSPGLVALVLAALVGGWLSTLIVFRAVIWVNSQIKAGDNLTYSAAGSMRYKHFVRMRIDSRGDLSCYVIGLDPVGEGWHEQLTTPNGAVPPWDPAGPPRLHYVWGGVFPKFDPPPVRLTLSVSDGEGTVHDTLDLVFKLVCEALIDRGHTILYGGLPQFGYTRMLADYVAKRQGDQRVGRHIQNYVAACVDGEDERKATLTARMQYVVVPRRATAPSAEQQEMCDFTALREALTDTAHVRLVLGGRIEPMETTPRPVPNRRAPGVLEEAYLSLMERKPLLVAGGFGGCGTLLARLLLADEDHALINRIASAYSTPAGTAGVLDMIDAFRTARLAQNGLSPVENRELWTTPDPTVAATLVLRAVDRLAERGVNP